MPTLPSATISDSQIDDFRGPWTRLDSTDVPATEALLARNSSFDPGAEGTRYGFTPLFDPQAVVTSIYDWLKNLDGVSIPQFGTGHFTAYYDKTYGVARLIVGYNPTTLAAWTPATSGLGNPIVPLFSVAAEGISYEAGGTFLFMASYDANGSGVAQMRIFTVTPDGYGFAVDRAFLGINPITMSAANSAPLGNQVTAGLHNFQIIVTSRTGFTGPLSPGTATAVTAPGGQGVVVTVNGAAFPPEASFFQVVMTPVSNPYQYFAVPGAIQSANTFTHTLTINISDQELIQNATDVTDNQFFFTQDSGGNGPFNPFKVLAYGSRMVYLANQLFSDPPAVYVSDPYNFQQLSADQNKLTLPSYATVSCGFVLRGILYITGPNWTYSFQDTGGSPVSWPSATLVDNRIGCSNVEGVVVNASNGWAAIVHVTGLYIFNGEYGQQPLTYMVQNYWNRINWNAKQTIRIADNKDLKKIAVNVPLICNSVVGVSGTTMTLVSGDQFSIGWSNLAITINGTAYTISSVQSYNSATLTTSATIIDGTAVITSPIPTHQMTFDYTDGIDYTTVKFSLDSIEGFSPRALAVMQNPYTGRPEFVMGAGAIDATAGAGFTAPMDRQMNSTDDLSPYADNVTHGVKHAYEIAPQPDGATGTIFSHVGGYFRAKGNGNLVITVYPIDRATSLSVNPISLQPRPGVEYWRAFYLNSERASVRWETGDNPGDYVIMSSYRHRFYPWSLRR